jgi:hypothetical protein
LDFFFFFWHGQSWMSQVYYFMWKVLEGKWSIIYLIKSFTYCQIKLFLLYIYIYNCDEKGSHTIKALVYILSLNIFFYNIVYLSEEFTASQID